jgi:hypothetical protein
MKDDGKRGMTDEEAGSFLGRWSRRKIAAREGKPLPEPARTSDLPARTDAPQSAQGSGEKRADERGETRVGDTGAAPLEGPPRELPAINSLRGLESEYGEFLRPDVDEETRRAALKKLFADPHFNRMDGLDVYIDDYSQPDPIPAAMLRTLSHAKNLLFSGEEEGARAGTAEPESGSGADAAMRKDEPQPTPPARSGGVTPAAMENDSSCPDPSQLSSNTPDTDKQG